MISADPVTWRVLTWNLRGSAQPDLSAIADVIAQFEPDVVALQEVQHRQGATLANVLGWNLRWARKHYPYTPLVWWRAEGLAILSHHTISDVAKVAISPGVSTWTYRHRVLLAATVHRDGAALRVYDTHLAAHDRADERIAQAARVAAQVARDAALHSVVAGDLNAPGEVEVVREFHIVGLRDPGGGPTSPSIAPRQRLDYVLVPRTATVTDQQQPDGDDSWWALSDHLPVLVEFRLG